MRRILICLLLLALLCGCTDQMIPAGKSKFTFYYRRADAQLHLFVKNFFRSFSKSFLTCIRFAVTLSSARIYYQSKSRLSTLFFEFLQIILWLLLVVLIAAESPNIQPRPAPMHSRQSSRSQSAARTSARQAPSFPMAF